jgi:membrane carboxypeptidase/penicillin-binding protein
MMKATALYPPRDPEHTYFSAPSGVDFAKIDAETLLLANDSCTNTFEEAFIAGTAPTRSCSENIGTKISDAVETTVAEPVKEAAKGVGKVLGKVFGGLFGGDKSHK